MKDILEYIVKTLVRNKDKVSITEEKDGNFIRYIVEVDRDDFGKVIGHEGKIAKDIRTIMGAIATMKEVKVVIDIR
ncbi:MAG: KH domain-containing protein [Lachnospiraceae bacterium]|nr:KH domain-containing protein [Lachnospiraceae bacterium]